MNIGKFDYGDIYRFLVSAGLVLLALSILYPWFVLTGSDDLRISQLEYDALTENSKELFDRRINVHDTLICIIPYVSFPLLALGLFGIIFGLIKWKIRQGVSDSNDELELQLKKLEIKKRNLDFDTEQVDEKTRVENIEKEIEKEQQNAEEEEEVKVAEKKPIAERALDVEQLLIDKINDYNPMDYEVKTHVRIRNNHEFDILLESNTVKRHDKIIEVKFIQTNLNFTSVRDYFNRTSELLKFYIHRYDINARGYLLIVVDDDLAKGDQWTRFYDKVRTYHSEIKHERLWMGCWSRDSFEKANLEFIYK